MSARRFAAWFRAAGAGAIAGAVAGGVACDAFVDLPEGHLVDAGQGGEDVTAPGVDSGVETASVPFCSTVSPSPRVCSDFDEQPSDPTAGWDNASHNPDPGLVGGGQRALDGQLFHSSPFSLALTMPALKSGTDSAAAYLLKTIPSSPATLVVGEQVYISSVNIPSGPGGFTFLAVLFGNDLSNGAAVIIDSAGVALSINTAAGTTRVGFTASTGDPAPSLPLDDWLQIDFVISRWQTDDAGGTGLSIQVSANGTKGYNAEATAPLPFLPTGMPAFVTVGLQGVGPMDKVVMNFDDVYLSF